MRLTKQQKTIYDDLLRSGEPLEKSRSGSSYYYMKPTGDKPSEFGHQYKRVSALTVDRLFQAGKLRRIGWSQNLVAVPPEKEPTND